MLGIRWELNCIKEKAVPEGAAPEICLALRDRELLSCVPFARLLYSVMENLHQKHGGFLEARFKRYVCFCGKTIKLQASVAQRGIHLLRNFWHRSRAAKK